MKSKFNNIYSSILLLSALLVVGTQSAWADHREEDNARCGERQEYKIEGFGTLTVTHVYHENKIEKFDETVGYQAISEDRQSVSSGFLDVYRTDKTGMAFSLSPDGKQLEIHFKNGSSHVVETEKLFSSTYADYKRTADLYPGGINGVFCM